MALRDIRPDLRERLRIAVDARSQAASEFDKELKLLQAKYQPLIQRAHEEERMLTMLLEAEDRRLGPPQDVPPQTVTPELPLAEYLERVINLQAPRSKEELRELAVRKGYFGAQDGGGRAIHTTLLNLVRSGRIMDLGDGSYGPPLLGAPAARISAEDAEGEKQNTPPSGGAFN